MGDNLRDTNMYRYSLRGTTHVHPTGWRKAYFIPCIVERHQLFVLNRGLERPAAHRQWAITILGCAGLVTPQVRRYAASQ
jgi:hypothetical protein